MPGTVFKQELDTVRIIVVHGRGSRPPKECEGRYVRRLLTESVRRADPRGGRWLASHPQTVQLAYYGDLICRLTGEEPEPCHSYREAIRRLREESWSCPTWESFRARMKDLGADVLGLLVRFLNQAKRRQLLLTRFPDVTAYFTRPRFAAAVRDRLAQLLVPSLERRHHVLLISHSLGSVVAYDLLWELSHRPKFRSVRNRWIDGFATLGSPLGDETVREHLLGSDHPLPKRYPTNIRSWFNFSARGDLVCYDARLSNDFRAMRRLGLIEQMQEFRDLCNVYRSREGRWNPHKLYGYLVLPEVGRLVSEFL